MFPGKDLLGPTAILMAGNVASRLLGLAREQVIAAMFGASGPTSAYRSASRLVIAVYDLLISGAISSAMVPIFSDYASGRGQAALARLASNVLTLAGLTLVVAVAALMLVAPWVTSLLGTPPDSPLFGLTYLAILLALPSLIFLGLAGILSALLYARRRFLLPAFSTSLFNLGLIAVALGAGLRWGILALAVGMVLGAILQVVLQSVGVKDLRLRPRLDLKDPGFRTMAKLYGPVVLGLVVSNVGVIVDTNLAWRTGPESLATLGFATTLVQLPLGLVGTAAAMAALPTLSRAASQESAVPAALPWEVPAPDQVETARDDYGRALAAAIRMVTLLMLPATVGLIILREPIIQLLFQRQAFDEAASQRTALAFLAYSPQIPFAAVDQLLIAAFYARKDTITPVAVGILGTMIYLGVALATLAPMGMVGLALANAVQNSSHAVILYFLLRRKVPAIRASQLGGFLARALAASACVAGALLVFGEAIAPGLRSESAGGQLLYVTVAVCIGGLAYVGALRVLGVQEVSEVWTAIRGKLGLAERS